MPRFKVRLEDPNSDEFRVTVVSAEDADEAKAICEARERRFVEAKYTDEELAAADEAGNRGVRHIHEQSEPYAVVAVVGRDEKFPKAGVSAAEPADDEGGDA